MKPKTIILVPSLSEQLVYAVTKHFHTFLETHYRQYIITQANYTLSKALTLKDSKDLQLLYLHVYKDNIHVLYFENNHNDNNNNDPRDRHMIRYYYENPDVFTIVEDSVRQHMLQYLLAPVPKLFPD